MAGRAKGRQVPNITLKPTSSERAAWTFPVIAWVLSNLDGYEQETQLTLHAGLSPHLLLLLSLDTSIFPLVFILLLKWLLL